MTLGNALRRGKHYGMLGRKATARGARTVIDGAYRVAGRARPYRFSVERHRDKYGSLPRMYFLHRSAPHSTAAAQDVPRRIFCFWTGDNDLTPGRTTGLREIERHQEGLEVILITPHNLTHWVADEHPLHPSFAHLSLVHRSDYLRAYFMAVHGGGYTDIKTPRHPWQSAFDRITEDPELWLVGYPERSSRSCGGDDHTKLGRDIHRRYGSLVGFGAFIMRGGTPFAWEWLQEIERRLDYYSAELGQNPGNTWGDNPDYPLRWIEIGSDVFHPLQLKYLDHVRQDDHVLPRLEGHR